MNMFVTFALIIFITFASLCCSINQKDTNDKAVENIRSQIKAEEFDKIYEQSSDLLKRKISKNDFIQRMSFAVNSMKDTDSTLNWHKPKNENEFYRDHSISDTSYRQIDNGVKDIGIFIYWSTNSTLCGFETSEIKVINACS